MVELSDISIMDFGPDEALPLDCGTDFAPLHIAYEQIGTLNESKTNAVLVCHALTGDQFAGTSNPISRRPPWWEHYIGPGKALDTNRLCIISTNALGGCMGTSGPSSLSPTGEPYGASFPVITIADMVRAQRMLIDHLGIKQLLAVIGGSMGAMQTLEWMSTYPDYVYAAIPIAGAASQSAQNIGFYETGRQAIMADPDWCEGHYISKGVKPSRGLAVARMAAHITYVSEQALKTKFDRGLQDREALTFGFDADFQIESYLRHQGRSFTDRFDANSYLYITRAMDYFDMEQKAGGRLAEAFRNVTARVCVFAFSSDWHYPPEESRRIVRALNAAGVDVSFMEIETEKGHDAFLLEEPQFMRSLQGFVKAIADDVLSADKAKS